MSNDTSSSMSDPESAAAVERAMGRIRRSMARRALGTLVAAQMGRSADVAVFEAVHAVADTELSGDGAAATVGGVAERLGIDQSRGSRIVAAAVTAGYLRREASQTDGRQSLLVLTPAGSELMETIRGKRLAHFDGIMADWSEEERRTFARLLARFAESVAAPRG